MPLLLRRLWNEKDSFRVIQVCLNIFKHLVQKFHYLPRRQMHIHNATAVESFAMHQKKITKEKCRGNVQVQR